MFGDPFLLEQVLMIATEGFVILTLCRHLRNDIVRRGLARRYPQRVRPSWPTAESP
jgi:hypothetical protein